MLNTLQLKNFRSYQDQIFEFKNGVNIIIGPNASGKTNLLQAIHSLSTMKAFGSPTELLKHGCTEGRVQGVFNNQTRNLKLSQTQNQISIDGREYRRLPQNLKLPVVVFQPSDMLTLSAQPELRRNYLDTIIPHLNKTYQSKLRNYKRVLVQRNQILKKPNPKLEEVFVWDVQLVELAAQIVIERQKATEALSEFIQSSYSSIAQNSIDPVSAEYFVSKIKSTKNYANQLHRELKKAWPEDRQRGFTGVGPHRDDLLITIRGRLAKDDASRGELRSLILSLKLFELKLVQESFEESPILLLDDVFGELDGARRKALAKNLLKVQTFITSTDADVVVEHFADHNIIPL